MTQLRVELRPLHDVTSAASSTNGLHGELEERAAGGGSTSQLFPPVIGAVQQSILLIVTERIPVVLRHDGGDNLNFPRQTLAFIDPKTRDHTRAGIGGLGSGESQVRVK